eukprot:g17463.t1
MIGMLLGSNMTGISLTVDRLLTSLYEQGANTELLLCCGATRREACSEVLREAIAVGISPTVQGLAALGSVSIPGMMTGQILGGTVPWQAAMYQILIVFMLTAANVTSMILAPILATTCVLDTRHRLRLDLLTPARRATGQQRWRITVCGQNTGPGATRAKLS